MADAPTYPYAMFLDLAFPALTRIDVTQLVHANTHRWDNQTLCQVNESVVRLGVMHAGALRGGSMASIIRWHSS